MVFLSLGLVKAQEGSRAIPYSEVKEASVVYALKLDDHQDEFQSFFKQVHLFSNLKHLEISNYDQLYFPEDLKQLNIRSLTISNSPDIDFNSFFKILAKMPKLKALFLDGNDISSLPLNSVLYSKLEIFHIKNNEALNVKELDETIENMLNISSLNVSGNQLMNCPSQISKSTSLKSLDISNNNLKSLPDDFENLNSLDSLWIQGNAFEDIKAQLFLLKKNKLKFLCIDELQDERCRTWIYKNFPGIHLTEESSPVSNIIMEQERLPVSQRSKSSRSALNYGKISVLGKQFQALSNAYYHYPKLFNNRQFVNTFDSLLLEERYLDTNYSLTSKIDTNMLFSWVKIYPKNNPFKKNSYFKIYPKKPGPYYKIFPELRAFSNLKWIYTGDLDKKEFKSKYIKDQQWLDLRIYYDEELKKFTIELKSRSGFTEMEAVPKENINMKGNALVVYSEKQYLTRYLRYVKYLDTKKRLFHSRLLRSKRKYEKNMRKSMRKTWKDFQRVYMSPEEKKMSKAEWLLYYDKLVANEKKALASSKTDVASLTRSLELEKYLQNNFNSLVNNGYSTSHVSFVNQKNENLAVLGLIVIDLEDRSYYTYDGNLGIDKQSIFLKNSNLVLVAELRNGDVAYIDQNSLSQMRFNPDEEVEIQLKVIEKSLSTVGQMYQLLKL